MEKFIEKLEPIVTTAEQCQYGLTMETNRMGTLPALKPTGFMTNSPQAYSALSERCKGGHRHAYLVNGRAHASEVYPPKLCLAILQAIHRHSKFIRDNIHSLLSNDQLKLLSIVFFGFVCALRQLQARAPSAADAGALRDVSAR